MMGVRALSFSISGSDRKSKIVRMLSALRVWIPAAVTLEGSALRKRRSERVMLVGADAAAAGGRSESGWGVGFELSAIEVVVVGVAVGWWGRGDWERYPPMERKL